MRRILHRAILAAGILLATFLSARGQDLKGFLEILDSEMDKAGIYTSQKEDRISSLQGKLDSAETSEEKYSILSHLYDEYFSYMYVLAEGTLTKMDSIATSLHDREKAYDVKLKKALLNTVGGDYLEAKETLDQIDSTSLTGRDLLTYMYVSQRFWTDYGDFVDNGADERKNRISIAASYQDSLMARMDPSSMEYRKILLQRLIHTTDPENFRKADSLNSIILSHTAENDHDFAVHAYYQSLICEALGRETDRRIWLARSAATDVRTATKDNASAINLARLLFRDGDTERAFRYSSFSLQDANFYDAHLRQWQIAAIIPSIQESYTETLKEHHRKDRNLLIVVTLLGLATLAAFSMSLVLLHKRKKAQEQIENINSALAKANTAKDQYLGLFLSMCSNYIGKMKGLQSSVRKKLLAEEYDELIAQMSSQKMIDSELEEFYKVFDQSFLKLYPSFVEDFNRLLQPDKRIVLKDGELLNVELRIFALIRLGITQSSNIASFLRYSTNTIYNYRAQVKNAAIGDRETFEDRVREIGGNV